MTRLEIQRRRAAIHAQLVEKLERMEELHAEIQALEAEAKALASGNRLPVTKRRGNQKAVEHVIPRIGGPWPSVRTERFLEIAHAANHTMRSVAAALGCTHVHLNRALGGKNKIRKSWAETVQKLTTSDRFPEGYAAVEANWPAGWSGRAP